MPDLNNILSRSELERQQADLRIKIELLMEKRGVEKRDFWRDVIDREIVGYAKLLQFVNVELERRKNWKPVVSPPVRMQL